MNSNFSQEQIEAYASAFEVGDAIWCDGKWHEVVENEVNGDNRLTAHVDGNIYVINDGQSGNHYGFKVMGRSKNPYRVTTLEHYELQGKENVVWLGVSSVRLTYGDQYYVHISDSGKPYIIDDNGDDNYLALDSKLFDGYRYWGIIPRYKQVMKNEESKFKKGDKVLVNGFINGTIVEVLGNQKYLVSIVFRSGVEEINEFNEYQLELTMEEPPAPKVVNEQSSSNEIALDEVAIHSEIITRLVKQTIKGVKKYGDPVQHDNLSTVEWIDHAIDESVDQIVYLTALKHSLLSKEGTK